MKRSRIALLFSLVAALAVVPSAPGRGADGPFDFYGSGFGHGLGMSQWGAYGLSLKGWTHQQILTHFFSKTTVGTTAGPDKIRVGLTDARPLVHLAARNGPVELRSGAPGAASAATIPAGSTYVVKAGTGHYKIVDGNGHQIATAVGSKKLFATYQDGNGMVWSPEAGHTYNRGYIEIDLYKRCDTCGSSLRMNAILSPQMYLYGLGEVPSSWPQQALQAQADAARTYAFNLIEGLGQHRAGCDCGVYDDTRNQVYSGWDHEGENGGSSWRQAVDATAGEVVLFQGKLIQAQYMSSSGGYTENNENVWPGSPIPYLRGVCDPGDYTTANGARAWHVTLSAQTVTDRLRPYTGNIGTVRSFDGVHRGVSGRIKTVKVVGGSGSKVINGTSLRSGLSLMDDRVWIDSDRNVTGAIRTRYDDLGCAPGLPASPQKAVPGGLRQRFAQGAIYRNTSAGKTIWLYGAIYAEYRRAHESSGVLGMATTKVARLTQPAGCGQVTCLRAKFVNGWIVFKDDTDAHELHGDVFGYFLAQQGLSGHLGFPTTDVTKNADGSTQATFQGKGGNGPIVVTCPKSGSCSEASS